MSRLDLCCLQTPIIIARGSERCHFFIFLQKDKLWLRRASVKLVFTAYSSLEKSENMTIIIVRNNLWLRNISYIKVCKDNVIRALVIRISNKDAFHLIHAALFPDVWPKIV